MDDGKYLNERLDQMQQSNDEMRIDLARWRQQMSNQMMEIFRKIEMNNSSKTEISQLQKQQQESSNKIKEINLVG